MKTGPHSYIDIIKTFFREAAFKLYLPISKQENGVVHFHRILQLY